jgi:hypothetical protein
VEVYTRCNLQFRFVIDLISRRIINAAENQLQNPPSRRIPPHFTQNLYDSTYAKQWEYENAFLFGLSAVLCSLALTLGTVTWNLTVNDRKWHIESKSEPLILASVSAIPGVIAAIAAKFLSYRYLSDATHFWTRPATQQVWTSLRFSTSVVSWATCKNKKNSHLIV